MGRTQRTRSRMRPVEPRGKAGAARRGRVSLIALLWILPISSTAAPGDSLLGGRCTEDCEAVFDGYSESAVLRKHGANIARFANAGLPVRANADSGDNGVGSTRDITADPELDQRRLIGILIFYSCQSHRSRIPEQTAASAV